LQLLVGLLRLHEPAATLAPVAPAATAEAGTREGTGSEDGATLAVAVPSEGGIAEGWQEGGRRGRAAAAARAASALRLRVHTYVPTPAHTSTSTGTSTDATMTSGGTPLLGLLADWAVLGPSGKVGSSIMAPPGRGGASLTSGALGMRLLSGRTACKKGRFRTLD
jgi:hypothetical protein